MKNGKKLHRRYPFSSWFARKTFSLRRGIDYEVRTYSMAQQIRNAAISRGLSVSIEIAEDEGSLTVNAWRS